MKWKEYIIKMDWKDKLVIFAWVFISIMNSFPFDFRSGIIILATIIIFMDKLIISILEN